MLVVAFTGFFFFFQAEDGIRDYKVTGVQTCALPISPTSSPSRARDGDDVGAAHGHAAGKAHDGVLRFPLPAHLLVWLGDVDDVLNAGKPFQARGVDPSVVPDQADRGALRPRHGPGLVPHLLDHRDDAPDLRLGRAVTHHDQHRYFPPMVNRSPSRAAVTRPVNRVPAARAGSEVSTGG